jgi:hypothetical protein
VETAAGCTVVTEVAPFRMRGCRTCDDNPCNRTSSEPVSGQSAIRTVISLGKSVGMQKSIYRQCQTAPPVEEGITKAIDTVTTRVLPHWMCAPPILGLSPYWGARVAELVGFAWDAQVCAHLGHLWVARIPSQYGMQGCPGTGGHCLSRVVRRSAIRKR